MAQSEGAAKTNWVDFAAILATSTLAGLSMSLSFPLLSLVLKAEGADAATIGWSAAGHGLGVLLAAPFFGWLIHHLKPTGAMQLGLLTSATVVALLPFHVDPLVWFFARLIIGASNALIFVVSEAAINALVDERRRAQVLGLYATLFCIGYASGPLIVGFVGTEGFLPFLIGSGALLLGIIPAGLARSANTALGGGEASFSLSRIRAILKKAPLPVLAIFVFGLNEAGQFALLPLYGISKGLEPQFTGVMLSVWIAGNIIFQIPVGWVADRWSRPGMLMLMSALTILTLISLPFVIDHPIWLWPFMLIMGASLGALYTLSLSLLGERFRGPDLAMANTGFIVAIEMGVMLGPAIGGTSMTLFGAVAFAPTFALILLLLLAVTPKLHNCGKS